jgi:hypothetical protein
MPDLIRFGIITELDWVGKGKKRRLSWLPVLQKLNVH